MEYNLPFADLPDPRREAGQRQCAWGFGLVHKFAGSVVILLFWFKLVDQIHSD